jgi:probable F420-dependent oxidoreductase
MKFGLMYANGGPFAYPEMLTHLATTAERVGVESMWTIEHVVIPVGYKSTYPYDPSGKIPAPDQLPIPDPLVALAFAAAVTKQLRLATGILILPQRHPLYVAKEVASLDVLSHGRVILGIGVGWLKEEFDALGIPFEERAARTAESVRAMRSLWKDEAEPFEGKFFRWASSSAIQAGAEARRADRRRRSHELAARRARYGDGFFPASRTKKLIWLLDIMRDECKKLGRNPASIEVTSAAPCPTSTA